MKIALVFFVLCNTFLGNQGLSFSSKPAKLILEMITGVSESDVLICSEFDVPSFVPDPQNIIDAGSSKAFFYLSETFEPWIIDIPVENKINLSDFLKEEDKIYLDSNLADFWWLNPEIIIEIIPKIADTLSILDQKNADKYKSNSTAALDNLELLHSYCLGLIEKVSFSPLYEEFPTLIYYSESFGIPYADFLFYDLPSRKNPNLDFRENITNYGARKFLTLSSFQDSTTNELALEIGLRNNQITIFPRDNQDYYSLIKNITISLKKYYKN